MTSGTFAVFGDIHGNWQALEAVWSELDRMGVRHRLCLGDLVGYGADPVRCVDWIRETETPCIQGNHDYYVATGTIPEYLSYETGITLKFAHDALGGERRKYLGDLPTGLEFDGFEAVHASLPNPLEWAYVIDETTAKRHLGAQSHKVGFVGHTHHAAIFAEGDPVYRILDLATTPLPDGTKVVINPGAVGQQRNHDNRARFAVFNVIKNSVQFHRLEYDVNQAANRCIEVGLPELLAQRLRLGI
jgi:predicted phosphodiesterase